MSTSKCKLVDLLYFELNLYDIESILSHIHLLCLKAWQTLSRVRWSPSMWANLILASSAAFLASLGRTKHCGTKQDGGRGKKSRIQPIQQPSRQHQPPTGPDVSQDLALPVVSPDICQVLYSARLGISLLMRALFQNKQKTL